MTADLVIENCRIVTPHGVSDPGLGVAVADGKIAAIGTDDDLPDAARTVDARGDYLAPGVVDCHIHTRSPGYEYAPDGTFREDWETATRSAAAGGVTTVLAMPNTDPLVDRPAHLETVFELIEANAYVDAGSYGILTADNLEHLRPLVDAGAVGFKCFLYEGGYYDFNTPNDGELYEAMDAIAGAGARVAFHEENAEIVNHAIEAFRAAGKNEPIHSARSRPVLAEVEAVSRMTLFSEQAGCPVHMAHVSSGSAAEVVARAKARGIDVTAETMPHYLQFTVDDLAEKGSAGRVNPPLRTREEQDLLWEAGVHSDGIDCFATDHAPYTDDEKGMDDPFQSTWNTVSGFVGVETQVPAMLTLVDEGRLSHEKWLQMHSRRPAQIWGLYPKKGALQVGSDGDVAVFDPDEQWTLDRHDLRSKNSVTPYDGETFTGKVEKTFVRGELVFDGEEVVGEPSHGEVIRTDS